MTALTLPAGFSWSEDNPFADAHVVVSAWLQEAAAMMGSNPQNTDLRRCPSGIQMLEAKPQQARRFVVAAVSHVQFWDDQLVRVRKYAEQTASPQYYFQLPEWDHCSGYRNRAESVIRTLMRRKLPFTKDDLLTLVNWCIQTETLTSYEAPIKSIVRALDHYASKESVDAELRDAAKKFAARLHNSAGDIACFAPSVEKLCAVTDRQSGEDPIEVEPAPNPAPAGVSLVLVRLKQAIGMLPPERKMPTTVIGIDQFPVIEHSPLRQEHELLSQLLDDVRRTDGYYNPTFDKIAAYRKLRDLEPVKLGRIILAASERDAHWWPELANPGEDSDRNIHRYRGWISQALVEFATHPFRVTREELFDLLLYCSSYTTGSYGLESPLKEHLFAMLDDESIRSPLTEGERFVLGLFRERQISVPPLGFPGEEIQRLTRFVRDDACFCLVPGEIWSDAVNQDFAKMDISSRRKWADLFAHALTATSARPSPKWIRAAEQRIAAIGADQVRQRLEGWLPQFNLGEIPQSLRTYSGEQRSFEENETCFRGLLWLVPNLQPSAQLLQQVESITAAARSGVPGLRSRAPKIASAGNYALTNSTGP